MSQYYVLVNGVQKGPYTLQELRELNPASSTMAWTAGMASWQPLYMLPEVGGLFGPPPAPSEVEIPDSPNLHIVPGVFAVLFFWPLGVAALICSVLAKVNYDNGEYDKAESYSNLSIKLCKGVFVIYLAMLVLVIVMAILSGIIRS